MPADLDAHARLAEVDLALAGVDAALRRLDDGTYGTCTRCGAPIADAVLADDPLETTCASPCAGA